MVVELSLGQSYAFFEGYYGYVVNLDLDFYGYFLKMCNKLPIGLSLLLGDTEQVAHFF